MSTLVYRPEIDGLRAVSVLAVVLYHAGLGCPGGYVGVDVFLVISGYLITSLILESFDTGAFTFREFWERRVRRILPASLFMMGCVLLAGYLLLVPHELLALAQSALAQLLFTSNVYFSRIAWFGYFDDSAYSFPLLQTWSLSLEEQFYLLYPVLLYFVRNKNRAVIALILGGLWIGSFLLSVWSIRDHKIATFYLLPPRGWELLTGALVALGGHRLASIPRSVAECGSLTGLVGIVATIVFYDEWTTFPSWGALTPCLGCAAIIAGTARRQTIVGRLLSCRPLVGIGVISYSLYLWHWPIFAYYRILFGGRLQLIEAWTLVAVSFFAGWCSWRFIEQPFRMRRFAYTQSTLFKHAAGCTLLLLAITAWWWRSEGMGSRVSASLQKDAVSVGGEYEVQTHDGELVYPTLGASQNNSVDFAIWGDSHGSAIAAALDEAASERGISGSAILRSGICPLPGVLNERNVEFEWYAAALRHLREQRVMNVLFVARWRYYSDGPSALETREGALFMNAPCLICGQGENAESLLHGRERLFDKFDELLTILERQGVRIWILRQPPEQNESHLASRWLRRHTIHFPAICPFDPAPVHLSTHRESQANATQLLEKLVRRHSQVTLIDPTAVFFDDPVRPMQVIRDGHCSYRDDDHLSYSGSKVLVSGALRDMLDRLASNGRRALEPDR